MAGETILIIEDERAVARGLAYGLEAEGFNIIWADTGKKALEMVHSHNPDLLLLDIRLPDISGFDICRKLRKDGRRQPILMLTARDEEFDRVLGLELGADDYIVKPYSLREVISRVRAHLRRAYGELSEPVTHKVQRFGDVEIDMQRMQVTKGSQPVTLTPTEYKILRYLLGHPERPRSRDAIIEAVWGYDGEVTSDRTVDVHIRHLREKLEDDPTEPRYLITVRGIGYKFQP